MQKFDNATDSLVLNWKNIMHIGTIIPPPPIPAALENAIMMPKTIKPKNSSISSGKVSFLSHSFFSISHIW